jgi:chromosome partitioning protein
MRGERKRADDCHRQSEGRQRQDDARHQHRRLDRGQAAACRAGDVSKKSLKEIGAQWAVIDTAAGTHGDELREAVRRADVMLVPLSASTFDMAATGRFLAALFEHKAVKEGELALGLVAMRVDARTRAAADLDEFLDGTELPVVTHLRDTQVYVHCARDGASVFDLPRSRGEQDWEQWKPLARWISRHAARHA